MRLRLGFQPSITTLFVTAVLFVGLTLVYLSFDRATSITLSAASTFVGTVRPKGFEEPVRIFELQARSATGPHRPGIPRNPLENQVSSAEEMTRKRLFWGNSLLNTPVAGQWGGETGSQLTDAGSRV